MKRVICRGVAAPVVAVALTAGAGVVWVGAANAVDYSYSLGYGAEYSSNVRLTAANPEDELTSVVTAGFQLTESGRELDARAQARVGYRDYHNDTYSDYASAGLNGVVVWKPLFETFHWTVEDVYTQAVADRTAADTPDNRINVNVFSTGPDLFWRFSPVHTLQLAGRYTASGYDTTENTASDAEVDNTRRSGSARWLYRASSTTTLSLGHLVESVRFDDSDPGNNLDFRRHESSVGMSRRLARNTLTLDLGETRIKREGQPEIDGALGRLSWIRELSSDSSFALSASRSLSDTAAELLALSGSDVPTAEALSVSSSDIFVSKQADARYTRRRPSGSSVSLLAFRSERVYELTPETDEISKGVGVDYGYSFSQKLGASISARYTRTRFPSLLDRKDEGQSVGLGLEYRYSRAFIGGIQVGRQTRSSTVPSAEFVENRAAVTISYNSVPTRW